MLRRLKLRNRMLLLIFSTVFISFAFTIYFAAEKVRETARVKMLNETGETALHYGKIIKAEMEKYLDISRTLAETFEAFLNTGQIPKQKFQDHLFTHLLKSHPDFMGIWMYMEADALAGKEQDFINSLGYDSAGRYIPHWNRASGIINIEPFCYKSIKDEYLNSLKNGMEIVFNPFICPAADKKKLITAFAVPIKYNGKVTGALGISMSLSVFNKMIKKMLPLGSGYAMIISNKGIVAAHPETELIGKDARKYYKNPDVFKAVAKGEKYILFKKSIVSEKYSRQIFTPFYIGKNNNPWSLGISVPRDKIMEDADNLTYAMIIISSISLFFIAILIFFISKKISDPIVYIARKLYKIADKVDSSALKVYASGQQLSEGVSHQNVFITQTSASLEKVASMSQKNGENAKYMKNTRGYSVRTIKAASQSMKDAASAMENVKSRGLEIEKIIKVIDEIAFQTNLLSLNAAVEAARAGESGAGFAIVAEEVRGLALRSAQAAKDTQLLIDRTVNEIQTGFEQIEKTQVEFNKAVENNKKAGKLINEIALVSDEQTHGIHQMNQAVLQMEKVTQANAATAEESAAASDELDIQARQMKDAIHQLISVVQGKSDKFKLN